MRVTVFCGQSRRDGGWVAPNTTTLGLSLPGPRRLGELADMVKHIGSLGVDLAGDTEAMRLLQTFADQKVRADELRNSGQVSEALLHFIMAVESVLSSRQQTTDAVTNRSAAVGMLLAGGDYVVLLKNAAKLYDARSRYVHQGEHVSDELLEPARELVGQVAQVLLALARVGNLSQQDWLKKLDHCAAAFNAGERVDASVRQTMGLDVAWGPRPVP
jgi:hypothetical protein